MNATNTPECPARAVSRTPGRLHSKTRLLACLGIIAGWVALQVSTEAGGANFPRGEDYDYEAPVPGTYKLPVIKEAADGRVLDAKGQPLRLRDLTRDRVTVMSFIYTRCAAAKACPYATGVLAGLHKISAEDPDLAAGLRLISMSFDSEGDRPEQMAAYSALAEGRKGAAEWRFLTTPSREDLRPILKAYGQAVDRRANPNDPEGPLYHTLRVFLIDAGGRIRNIYSAGTLDPRLVLADIRNLLLEQGAKTEN